jgi:hypothetical protein
MTSASTSTRGERLRELGRSPSSKSGGGAESFRGRGVGRPHTASAPSPLYLNAPRRLRKLDAISSNPSSAHPPTSRSANPSESLIRKCLIRSPTPWHRRCIWYTRRDRCLEFANERAVWRHQEAVCERGEGSPAAVIHRAENTKGGVGDERPGHPASRSQPVEKALDELRMRELSERGHLRSEDVHRLGLSTARSVGRASGWGWGREAWCGCGQCVCRGIELWVRLGWVSDEVGVEDAVVGDAVGVA